jgi:Protein of unknown function (DUF3224)
VKAALEAPRNQYVSGLLCENSRLAEGVALLRTRSILSRLFGCGAGAGHTNRFGSLSVVDLCHHDRGDHMTRADGTFEVKLSPQAADDQGGGAALGRMLIDKQFHGDLEATSKGQMLAHMTGVKGSAGYVAMEVVTGRLGGRSGVFVLQHTGTMSHGSQQLSVTVVPDSGTGELAGLTGKMAIIIADGKHSYEFEYAIPEKH